MTDGSRSDSRPAQAISVLAPGYARAPIAQADTPWGAHRRMQRHRFEVEDYVFMGAAGVRVLVGALGHAARTRSTLMLARPSRPVELVR